MIKCGVDDKALKQIQSKTALVLRTYLKNKEPMSTLKANMQQLLDKIAQQYELTNINDIVNTIIWSGRLESRFLQYPEHY